MLFYKFVHLIVARGSGLLYRAKVIGRENLPKSGGYVLAPSHRSMMDIPFLAYVTPKRVRFMGKKQAFDLPVLGTVFGWLGAFPVARDGTDRKAVRDSIEILHDKGEPLVVYPEGTRQHGNIIQPLQPGAAYLAIRAGVPIVPVGIAGSEQIFRSHGTKIPHFGRVAVVVGEPLQPPPLTGLVKRDVVDELTNRLAKELQEVFDDANAARAAG